MSLDLLTCSNRWAILGRHVDQGDLDAYGMCTFRYETDFDVRMEACRGAVLGRTSRFDERVSTWATVRPRAGSALSNDV